MKEKNHLHTLRFPGRASLLLVSVWGASMLLASPLAVLGADADLEPRIDEAIRRGRESLMPTVKNHTASPPRDYPMGRLALPLAAVLKAGASTKDPVVTDAFERLERMQPQKSYSVACYLFALDALWQRRFKESLLGGGKTVVASSRKAKGKVRDRIVEMVNWLVTARNETKGTWTYGPSGGRGGRHDFSNSQFAILGLQIGLEHGVPIPTQVFTEIARTFTGSQTLDKNAKQIKVTLATSLEDLLGRTRVVPVRSYSLPPGGWAYTASRNNPYESMTAAGTSSLIVARNGLRFGDARLKAAVERAIVSGYGWIANHFDGYMRGTRHYYYTLYSLEKVGDLGGIERFGEHDWYVEGAEELLKRQRGNGSWGNYVDTSFALLFLTRATRLNAVAAPKIITRAQGEGQATADPDLVYVSRLDGFLSARAVLSMLGESRRGDLIDVGAEVVRHYREDLRGDLVGPLLALWTSAADRVSRFARDTLREITGLSSRDRDDYLLWNERYRRIRALERGKAPSLASVVKLFRETESIRLKARLLDLAQRHSLRGLAGEAINELLEGPLEYRYKVHGLLVLWTGEEMRAPAADSAVGEWEDLARRWRAWWQENETTFVARRRALELIQRLDSARGKEAEAVVDELARIGPVATEAVRAAMARPEYSFYLIEALERLTGETIGLHGGG